MTHDIIL